MTKHKSLRVKIAIGFLHLLGLDYILGVAFPEGIQTSFSANEREILLAMAALMLVAGNTLREEKKDESLEMLRRVAAYVYEPEEEEK